MADSEDPEIAAVVKESMETPQSTSRSQAYWRVWDRRFRWGILFSVLAHVAIIFMFRETVTIPELDYAAAGEDAGDESAAAGGGMEMVALRVTEAPPAPEVEEAEPVPVEPEPTIEPVPEQEPPEEPARAGSQSEGQTNTAGQGRGQDAGPGTDRGTGRGDAGDADAGTGDSASPAPRSLILPPADRPSSVRGKNITMYAFVDQRGRVVADSTRLVPSTGDRRFDNRLKQQASEWTFRPATRDGRPVAAWFSYTYTF